MAAHADTDRRTLCPPAVTAQAVDFNRGRRFTARRLAPLGPLQLEAVLAAGDLDSFGSISLLKTRKLEMPLIVGASHETCIAVLDFSAHLGIGAAAAIQILGNP